MSELASPKKFESIKVQSAPVSDREYAADLEKQKDEFNPDKQEAEDQEDCFSMCNQAKKVITNCNYMTMVTSISVMFWITTGAMYWFSDYLILFLKMPAEQVFISYGIAVITGPVVGVLLGGNIINSVGGYNTLKALYITLSMATFCVCVAVPIGFLDNYWVVVILFWFVLLAGGFVLPTMTGMMLNTVIQEHRTTAAAFSNIAYNCFGMIPAPFVYGLIA